MPKAQSGCEKQFRTELKKYSPALIKLNFIKAGFLPSDQLQWVIQGFLRWTTNNICKGKSYFWRGFGKSLIYWLKTLPSERSAIQISSLKNAHVYFIKLFTLPQLSSYSSFRSSLIFFTHCGFCCFAANSILMNSATLYLSISFSKDTGLCNQEVIWMLKESTIREVYEFLIIIIKNSIEPSQMQTLIIDLSETKFC